MLTIQRQSFFQSPSFINLTLFVGAFIVVVISLHIYVPRNADPRDNSLINQIIHEANNSTTPPKAPAAETAVNTSPAVETTNKIIYPSRKNKSVVAQPTQPVETPPTPADPPAAPPAEEPPVVEDPPLPPEDPPPTEDPGDPPPTDP